jgi:hypothetical protein
MFAASHKVTGILLSGKAMSMNYLKAARNKYSRQNNEVGIY